MIVVMIVKALERLRREARVTRARAVFATHRVKFGRRPAMEYGRIAIQNGGHITIGERCFFQNIESRSLLRAVDGATLSIGSRAYVNSGVTITAVDRIEIGDWVKIGQNVAITDTAGHEIVAGDGIKSARVRIGNNVWIGRNAFISPGVTIGDNAIIGTGAVVRHDVPADCIATGSPATVVRQIPASARPRK